MRREPPMQTSLSYVTALPGIINILLTATALAQGSHGWVPANGSAVYSGDMSEVLSNYLANAVAAHIRDHATEILAAAAEAADKDRQKILDKLQ